MGHMWGKLCPGCTFYCKAWIFRRLSVIKTFDLYHFWKYFWMHAIKIEKKKLPYNQFLFFSLFGYFKVSIWDYKSNYGIISHYDTRIGKIRKGLRSISGRPIYGTLCSATKIKLWFSGWMYHITRYFRLPTWEIRT